MRSQQRINTTHRPELIALVALASTSAWSQDASIDTSQPAAAPALEQVVVTARRREERSQDVPISLAAIRGEDLDRSRVYLASDIVQRVPNMQMQFINPRQTAFSVRGLGNNPATEGLETSVGLYLDGVYISRPGMLTSDLSDIEQVTVLRGPQGTLFGKNTTAGAVTITTRRPEQTFGGDIDLSMGRFGLRQERLSVTGPLSESWSGRLSAWHTDRDGTIDNIADGRQLNDQNKGGARGQLFFEPSDTFNLRVIADYSHQQEDSGSQVLVDPGLTLANGSTRPNNVLIRAARFGYTPTFDPFARKVDILGPQSMETTNRGASVEANWTVGGYTLTSLSAWRSWEFLPRNDLDYLPLEIQRVAGGNIWNSQYSQEFRVASSLGQQVDFVAGAFLYRQRVTTQTVPGAAFGSDAAAFYSQPGRILPAYVLEGVTSNVRAEVDTDSYALFGQATWHISDSWSLTAGLRNSWDEKEASVARTRSGGVTLDPADPYYAAATAARNALAPPDATSASTDSESNWSGLLSLSYKPAEAVLLYASLARGVKSGGLNTSIVPAGVNPNVQPETATSVELGAKTALLHDTLRVNLDVFQADIDNYQTTVRDQVLLMSYLANAQAVRSRGFEFELDWLALEGLRFSTAVGYNEATYESFRNSPCGIEWVGVATTCDLTGKPVSGAPRWSGVARSEYAHSFGSGAVDGFAGVEYTFKSSSYYTPDDSIYTLIDGYGLWNAQLGVRAPSGRWEVSLWGRNLLDKDYFTALGTAPSGLGAGYVVGTVGDPLTFGATLRMSF
ncbi:MAG TPA: TonB-dependent receptor [Povalibacter sp.]|nr:TonB-dependent receptor [Povalibacter sp.]